MPKVQDSTKNINFLLRPIGFRSRQTGTVSSDDIVQWMQEKNQGKIKVLPNIFFVSLATALVGLVTSIVGFKKDSKLTKWLGGLITLIGIIGSGAGILFSKAFKQLKAEADTEEKMLFDELVLGRLKLILKAEESKRPKLRREMIIKKLHKHDRARKWLEKIKASSEDQGLKQEAALCLAVLSEMEKEIPSSFIDLQNKSTASEKRLKAIELLSELDNKRAIETLYECANDTKDDDAIRQKAIEALVSIKRDTMKDDLFRWLADPAENKKFQLFVAFKLVELVTEYGTAMNKTENDQLSIFLSNCVNDKDTEIKIRQKAIESLLPIKGSASKDDLLCWLSDPSQESLIRQEAAINLTYLTKRPGNNDILKRLIEIKKILKADDTVGHNYTGPIIESMMDAIQAVEIKDDLFRWLTDSAEDELVRKCAEKKLPQLLEGNEFNILKKLLDIMKGLKKNDSDGRYRIGSNIEKTLDTIISKGKTTGIKDDLLRWISDPAEDISIRGCAGQGLLLLFLHGDKDVLIKLKNINLQPDDMPGDDEVKFVLTRMVQFRKDEIKDNVFKWFSDPQESQIARERVAYVLERLGISGEKDILHRLRSIKLNDDDTIGNMLLYETISGIESQLKEDRRKSRE